MSAPIVNCLGCSTPLSPSDYRAGSDQPKVCADCLSSMTPAERAARFENARIIYLLNQADINNEHRESEEIPVARLARAIERLSVEIRKQQDPADRTESPPRKF